MISVLPTLFTAQVCYSEAERKEEAKGKTIKETRKEEGHLEREPLEGVMPYDSCL